MTSEKQTQANRRNARKSTGPKTSEGKAAVRHNALKHGLLAEEVLIAGEDKDELTALDGGLRDALKPVEELENMLVDRLVAKCWRLRRVDRVEASIFAWESYTELVERNRNEARRYVKVDGRDSLQEYLGTERPPEATNRTKLGEVLQRADELIDKQYAENTALGRTFIRDAEKANSFSKLSRYEASIERSLFKILHELQFLQANRRADGDV